MPTSNVYNQDCLTYMRGCRDKQFSLAIVDPPYGIGASNGKTFSSHKSQAKYKKKNWDNETPTLEYFTELFRVSENQIIWGGNHFTDKLPISKGWIYWDKDNFSQFSDGELAWSSFDCGLRATRIIWNGFRGKVIGDDRWHPTQKPISLYEWLLQNYAKAGDTILDTHLGSGSSRIAAWHMGFDFYGTETDLEYYNASIKRFEREKLKQELPFAKTIVEQQKLML